jgi:hypothetical protein
MKRKTQFNLNFIYLCSIATQIYKFYWLDPKYFLHFSTVSFLSIFLNSLYLLCIYNVLKWWQFKEKLIDILMNIKTLKHLIENFLKLLRPIYIYILKFNMLRNDGLNV